MIPAKCHPNKKHHAKDMCQPCYRRRNKQRKYKRDNKVEKTPAIELRRRQPRITSNPRKSSGIVTKDEGR